MLAVNERRIYVELIYLRQVGGAEFVWALLWV